MTDAWYSYAGFKFTKDQIKWAIANLDTLRNGVWPSAHKESGYVGEARSKQVSHEGNFVKAAGIYAELSHRIESAGVKGDRIHDGLLLEQLYCTESDDEIAVIQHLALAHGITIEEVVQRIRNALYFISGVDRKVSKYSGFIKNGRRYLKL